MIDKREFKKRVRALFLKNTPTGSMEWISAKFVTYPTGAKGWYGSFTAEAPGYRSAVRYASGDESYIRIT